MAKMAPGGALLEQICPNGLPRQPQGIDAAEVLTDGSVKRIPYGFIKGMILGTLALYSRYLSPK